MDKRDIASQAEKYKREMMKLYEKSTVPAEQTAEVQSVPAVNTRPEEEKLLEAPSEPEREIKTEPETAESAESMKTDEERYPEPDLSELEEGFQEEYPESVQPYYKSEEILGNSKGYILVNARTGDDSEPVVNASVVITATLNGKRMFMTSGVTNESGATRLFEVPVPDQSYSQTPDSNVRPYGLYDISVTADGFFNTRSVDVPVFPGITSVQGFSMIPVPLFMKASDETVTIYNQEPNL